MKVEVCTGRTCKSRFSGYILTRLENDKKNLNLKKLILHECPCTGNCKKWPNVIFDGKKEEYMNPAKASKIVLDTLNPKPKKQALKKTK